jgi:hypothetical protein
LHQNVGLSVCDPSSENALAEASKLERDSLLSAYNLQLLANEDRRLPETE